MLLARVYVLYMGLGVSEVGQLAGFTECNWRDS